MIPVEKIAGGTLGNLLYYVAIIGVLLVICTIIRLKVSFLRKAFIPASLLAGILGMILGPHVLGVIPADMMSSIGAIPSHMITIVFACMMLGVKKSENTSSMMHDAAAGLGWLWSNSFMQVLRNAGTRSCRNNSGTGWNARAAVRERRLRNSFMWWPSRLQWGLLS